MVFMSWLFPKMTHSARITLAILLEVGWELIENSPWMIEYYRTQTAAGFYAGDRIINSVMDVIAMVAGAIYARFYPWWATVGMVIILEVV